MNVLPIEQLLYYRRYLFSWLELYASYHRGVMNPNTHRIHFAILGFVHTYTLVTRKLQVGCGRSTYRMTVLLSQILIFCIKAGFETQMASYTSEHPSQSISDKSILCIRSPIGIKYFFSKIGHN